MSLLLPLLFACSGSGDVRNAPAEGFKRDTTVRLTAPTNGESVQSPFVVAYESGKDVAAVRVEAGEASLVTYTDEDGAGELVVELEPGRYAVELVGEDARGDEISRHTLTVRVVEGDESWLTITSPRDGATVTSPAPFTVEASEDIATVELRIDGLLADRVAAGELLQADVEATGRPVTALARGFDAEGALVATDELSITVTDGSETPVSGFNAYVVDRLAGYPRDGSYAYWWPSDTDWYGVTQDIHYRGELVAYGDEEHRSYCVGLTWELLMLSAAQIDEELGGDGTLNDLTVADLDDFRVDWFVRDLNGDGPGVAAENYGIGSPVTNWEDVRPGDFVQFWRHSGSGHQAVFVDWERDPEDDAIIGVRYWSTQGTTGGIDYNEEFFGSSGSRLDPSYFYVTRIAMPEDWVPWR